MTFKDHQCSVHGFHSPRPNDMDVHHVVPKSWGGPDVAANRIQVCQTGHHNVHELLAAYLRAGGKPSWLVLRRYGPGERAVAAEGWANRPPPVAG